MTNFAIKTINKDLISEFKVANWTESVLSALINWDYLDLN